MRSEGSAHGGFEEQEEKESNAGSCRIKSISKRRGGEAMEGKKELLIRREKTMSWPSRGDGVEAARAEKGIRGMDGVVGGLQGV